MSVQAGQLARMLRSGTLAPANACVQRRFGSSWSHGGVVQAAAQRSKAESMDRAVAAFARQHNVEIPERMGERKASHGGAAGHGGKARGAAGVLVVGGVMGLLISWINEEVKTEPGSAYQAVKKVVRRASQVGLGL